MARTSSTNNRVPILATFRLPHIWIAPLVLAVIQGCSDPPATSEEFIAQGDDLLARGQLAEAVESYRMAMHQDTLNPLVYARLSKAYNAQHKKGAADRYLRRAANITYAAGLQALEAGEDSTAQAAFEQTLDILPQHPLALTKIAQIHQARNNSSLALLYLEKAAEANPDYADTYVKLGQLYAVENQPDKAKQAFNKAIEININAFRAYIGLGQVLLDERAWEDALSQFEKALMIDPQSPSAHTGLAKARSNIKAEQAKN